MTAPRNPVALDLRDDATEGRMMMYHERLGLLIAGDFICIAAIISIALTLAGCGAFRLAGQW